MTDPVEPRTEAGRTLIAAFVTPLPKDGIELSARGLIRSAVPAIEREAVNAERARWEPLLDAARAIARNPENGEGPYSYVRTDEIATLHAAVLALLERTP